MSASVSVTSPPKPKKKTNYINNKDFLAALVEYRKCVSRWKRAGSDGPSPRVSEYVGKCVLLICTRMATRPNFSGYSWREEMSADAIENCLQAVPNFDPAKSNNPFGYFSRIAWRAFLRRIDKEKTQSYVKAKNYERMHMFDEVDGRMAEASTAGHSASLATSREAREHVIADFERRDGERRAKKSPKSPKKSLKSPK